MFAWTKPFARRPARIAPTRYRLFLEPLERRDCPAAPTLTFSASILANNTVHLTGSVTTTDLNMSYVQFSGVISGSAQPNSAGQYDAFIDGSTLGTITAQAHHMINGDSSPVDATITSSAPTLTLTRSYSGGAVTLSGHVTDEDAAGHNVTFTGTVSGSATTDNNGDFTYTTSNWSSGNVSATTTDCWGLQSNTATVTLVNQAPVISNFRAIQGAENSWTFRGQVTDEAPAGLTVTLHSTTIAAVNNQTVTVGIDGSFSTTLQLPAGSSGSVTAQTWDNLNQASNLATTTL